MLVIEVCDAPLPTPTPHSLPPTLHQFSPSHPPLPEPPPVHRIAEGPLAAVLHHHPRLCDGGRAVDGARAVLVGGHNVGVLQAVGQQGLHVVGHHVVVVVHRFQHLHRHLRPVPLPTVHTPVRALRRHAGGSAWSGRCSGQH